MSHTICARFRVTNNTAFTQELAACRNMVRRGECMPALAALKRLFVDIRDAGDPVHLAPCLGELAWCCMRLGLAAEGLDCALAAQKLYSRAPDPSGEARCLAITAFLLLDLGLSDEAFETAEAAVELAESCTDSALEAFALNANACALAICRHPDLAQPLLERAIGLAQAEGDEVEEAFCLVSKGFCQAKMADFHESLGESALAAQWNDLAAETTVSALEKAEACGDLWCQRAALANGAEFALRLGDADLAGACLARHADLPGDPGVSLTIHYLYTLAAAHRAGGKLAEARQACRKALAMAEQNKLIDHQLNVLFQLCAVEDAAGNYREALALHRRFHDCYVAQSGEVAQRRAKLAAIRWEADQWRARASELADQALLDPLTGIANRRAFDSAFRELDGQDFALAILDLDHFKAVNDWNSHAVGDAVLKRVAAILGQDLPQRALLARLGGEEFALLFPATALDQAVRHCAGLLDRLRDEDWSLIAPRIQVTASIGLAHSDGTEMRAEVMALADERLYAAKAAGRNRLVAADHAIGAENALG